MLYRVFNQNQIKVNNKGSIAPLNSIEVNPLFKKSVKKIDKIESDINYHLYSNSLNNSQSFKAFDIERRMKKMKKRIQHSSFQAETHSKCYQESRKENENLEEEHKQKLNQGRYLGDVSKNIKDEIKQIKEQILYLNQKTINTRFLSFQYNEQIKYLQKDLNEITTKVKLIRNERNLLLNKVKEQKEKIDKLIKGQT